jgi:hypothetical protein
LDDEQYQRAKNEWKAGKLTSALGMLEDLKGTGHHAAEAEDLKKTVAKTQGLMNRAERAAAKGECDEAIKLYREVLALNEAIDAAKKGEQDCRSKALPNTVE